MKRVVRDQARMPSPAQTAHQPKHVFRMPAATRSDQPFQPTCADNHISPGHRLANRSRVRTNVTPQGV